MTTINVVNDDLAAGITALQASLEAAAKLADAKKATAADVVAKASALASSQQADQQSDLALQAGNKDITAKRQAVDAVLDRLAVPAS